jgi:RNA polymerase sigma factor (TIGR02999 family)
MNRPVRSDVTALLVDLEAGNPRALDELIPLVYAELRSLAASYLRGEGEGATLQPTVLVHEAFLRLIDQRTATWQNRAHFFGVAARVMRRVIIDHARRRKAERRGGGRFVTLDEESGGSIDEPGDLIRIDEALAELEKLDERRARMVELRYFGGLTIEETAQVLGVSPMTVKRDWQLAKAWLQRALTSD